MTITRTETLSLTDGRELRVTIGEPESAVRGGLVVLHEARGMTAGVRTLVSSLAAEGWLAIAPHLYDADRVHGDDIRDQVSKLSGDRLLEDTDVAFVWLGQQGVSPDRMGVVGFDTGGTVAMVVAASRTIGAAVTVQGPGILEPLSDGLPALVDVAGDLTCPWLGIYRDDDSEEVSKLRDAVISSETASDVVRFDVSSDEAWVRALNWFDAHMR
ncbi:carboxymethylenebutenolidase [Lentzea atacamensis]|uniref:Carboxymethylenebutenolidase n=2 Tax=Lentzea TaxID=165301 RepID=A0A316ICA2_9PSEU|nr:dienelactone hydrolase family protein [Lentzea atacamensis]PWK90881.1 carboxymethylenebutenolidase [Lentzea atacamensis]RAS58904.1 carboxymethylenebutenolidase [Lentzea atacamensis]